MKIFKITLILLLIVSLISVSIYYGKKWVSTSPLFIISGIEITGSELIAKNSIVSLSEITTKMRIFDIKTSELKNKILSNKLIKDVSVKRIYPSTISIKIKEKQPVAFVISKKSYLLDETGELLPMPEQIRVYDLPVITGIKNIETKLKKNENIDELKTIINILKLIKKSEINLYNNISEINFKTSDLLVFYLYENAVPVYINKIDLYDKFYYLSQFLEYANFNKILNNIKQINLCYKDQIIITEKTN